MDAEKSHYKIGHMIENLEEQAGGLFFSSIML